MSNKRVIYELVTGILALLSAFIVSIQFLDISISQNELTILNNVDNLIYILFTTEYIVRLSLSKDKKAFIKGNIIDLISIIPFNAMLKSLRVLRLAKLLRLLKIISLVARFKDDTKLFLKTNYFGYVLLATIILTFMGAMAISYVENMNIYDAIWWAFATTTSTGYGDIHISTSLGRIIAIMLMILGVGFIGMLSGTVATYFITVKRETNKYMYETLDNIKRKLDLFEELTKDEVNSICSVLKSLKEDCEV